MCSPEIISETTLDFFCETAPEIVPEIVSEMFPEIVLEIIPGAMKFLQFLHYQKFIVWMFQKCINALSERMFIFCVLAFT